MKTIAEMEDRPAAASYADMVCEEEPPMAVRRMTGLPAEKFGIRHLLVNGEMSIEQGAAAGRRAGRPLQRG